MSTLLAVSRPTEWNFPLFVHVLGAMILVGGSADRRERNRRSLAATRDSLRLGYWTLLAVALPGL